MQCSGFDAGSVTGPLCRDLCHTEELKIERCRSSVPDKKVYDGIWKEKPVILKQAQHWFDQLNEVSLPDEDIQTLVVDTVESIVKRQFGRCASCKSVVAKFLHHADANNDGSVTRVEARNFLALVLNQEAFMVTLLNGSRHSVEFYGYCGGMYAVERVPANAEAIFGTSTVLQDYMFPDVLDQLDELLRALYNKLLKFSLFDTLGISNAFNFITFNAVSIIYRHFYQVRVPTIQERLKFASLLLEALQTLSENPYGALQSCDSHIGNYGLTNDSVIKLIDYDHVFGQSYLSKTLGTTKCEDECRVGSYAECVSVCNESTGYCSSDLYAQDLHNTCSSLIRTVFKRTAYEEFINPEDVGAQCQFKLIKKVISICQKVPVARNLSQARKNVDVMKELLTNIEEQLKACMTKDNK